MHAVSPVTDPGLPGLGLLLDDDTLRDWLAEHGERLVERCYLRYKPGTSCLAALRLESGRAFLMAASAQAQPKLDKLAELSRPGDVLACDPERHLLLATLRADRDLPALADLPGALARLLPGAQHAEVATLVHKPQRRWVGLAQLPAPTGPVLLRAYRRSRVSDAAVRLKLARRVVRRAVRVPRLLAKSSRSALLAVQYLPGTSVQAALENGTARPDIVEIGSALARVHGQEPTGLPAADVADPAATVELVGALLPHLRDRAVDLYDALAARRPASEGPKTACHGDFSLDQVVVDPTGAGLAFVDWDRGGAGHPAADLGSVLASGADAATMAELYDGYTRVRPLPDELDWHVDQALMLRLAEPFRTASPGWAGEVEERVDRLERRLG